MKPFFRSLFSSSVNAIVFALIFAGTLGSVAYAFELIQFDTPLISQLLEVLEVDFQDKSINIAGDTSIDGDLDVKGIIAGMAPSNSPLNGEKVVIGACTIQLVNDDGTVSTTCDNEWGSAECVGTAQQATCTCTEGTQFPSTNPTGQLDNTTREQTRSCVKDVPDGGNYASTYDSGWFSVTTSGHYTLEHDQGYLSRIELLFSPDPNPANDNAQWTTIGGSYNYVGTGQWEGAMTTQKGPNKEGEYVISVYTANTYVARTIEIGFENPQTSHTRGYLRILGYK